MSAMESSSFLQAVRLVKMGVEVHHAAEMCDMSLPDLRRQLFEDASENVIIEVSSSLSSSSSCNTSVTPPPATVSVFYRLEGGLLVFTLRSLLADYCVKKACSSSTELSEMAANPSTVSCSDGQRAHCDAELPPEISAAVHHTVGWFSCHTGLANESTKERIATVVQRLIKHSLLSPNETKTTTTTIAEAEISASSACADDVTCNRRRKFVIDARARLLAGLSQLCDGYLHSSQAWFIEGATLYKNGIKSYHNVIGGGDIDGASIDDSVKVYRTMAAAIANVGAGNGGGVVNATCANTDTSPVSGSTGSSQRPVISTTITTENERLSNDSINAFRQCHSSSDTTSIRGITIGGDNAMSVDGNVIAISSDHGMRQHDAVTGSCQSTVAQSSISTTALPTRLSAPDFNSNRFSPVSPITTISNSSPSSTSCLLLSDEEQGVLRGVVGRLVATRWTVSAGLLRWTLQCMLTAVGRRGELTRMDRLWPVWLDSLLDEWPELDAQLIISDTAVPNDRQLCRQIQRDIADALRQIGHNSNNNNNSNISNSPVVSSLARSSVQTASSTTTMPAATLTQQPRPNTNVETFSTSQPPASTLSLYTGVWDKANPTASNRTSIKSNNNILGGAIPERVRVKVEAQSPPIPHHRTTNSSIIDITTANNNHLLPTGNISASANKKTQPAKNTSDKITYQFDRILAKRRKPNQHTALNSGGSDDVDGVDEFLIKWRNYGSFYNVWLPRNQVPPEACHVLPSFEHWWDEQSVARQKRLRQLYDQQLQLSRQTLVRCKQTVVRRRASDGVPRGRINTTSTTTSGGDATVYTSTATPFGTGNVCSTTPIFPLTTTTTTTTATSGLQSAARIWPRSDLMPVQSQPSSITSTSTSSMPFLPSNPTITTTAADSVNRATCTPAAFDGSTELSAAALAKLRSVVKQEVCDDSLHVVDDDDMLQSLVESTIDDQHTAISSSCVGDGGTCGGDDGDSAMITDDNSGNLCEASPIVRILSRRYNTALQRVEYLVKWRGSSSEPSPECKTTWEPVEVITNGVNGTGIHLLQQFDRQAPISWRTTPKALGISGTGSGVFTTKLDKQQHSTLVSSDSNANNSAINRMLLINQKRQQQQQQLQYQSEREPSVDSDSELIPPSMLMVTMTEGENHQLLQHQEKSQQEDEQQQKEKEEDELSHATAIGQKDYTHWLLRPDSDGDADVSADDTPAVTKTIAPSSAASTSVAVTSSSASSFSLAGKSVKSASLVSSSPTSSSVKTISASPTLIGGKGSCVSHPVNAGGGVRDNCASIATKKRAAVLPATRVNDAKRSCPTPVRLPLITTTSASTVTATSESIQSLVHSLKQRAGIVCSKITNVPATTANSTSSTSSNVTDTVSISIKSEPSTVTSVSSRPALVTVNARGRVNKLPLDGVSSEGKPQILRKIIVPKHRMPAVSKLPTHSFENDCNVVVIAGSARTSTNRFGNENMARCRQKRRGMRCYRGRGACARSKHTQRRATMSASSRPKPNWLSGWYTRGSSATARASSARSAISASSGVSARSAIPASSGVSPRSVIYPRSVAPASSAVSPRSVVPASSAVSARSVVPALSAASDSGARKVQRPPADSIFRRRPGRPPLSRNKHFVCSQRRHSNASGNTATPADTVAASGKPARRHGNTQLPVGSVETILARRVVSSAPTSPQLLVKWKNFNRRYCTWEQEDVVSSSSSVCSPRQTTKLSHHEGGEFTVSARDIPHSAEYEESSPALSRRSSLPAVALSRRGRLLKRMRPASGEKRVHASNLPRSMRHNRARRSSMENCQFGGFSVYDLVLADHTFTCTNCCRIKTSSAQLASESVLAAKSTRCADVKKVCVNSSISKEGTLARGTSSAGTSARGTGTVATSVSSPLQPRIADIVDERLRVLTMWLLNNTNKQQRQQSLHPECGMIVGAPSERCGGGDGASAALEDAGDNEQHNIQSNTKFVIKPDITDICPTSVDSAGSTSSAKARDIEEFGNHTSSCSQLKAIDIGVDSSQSSGNNNNNNNSGKLCVNLRVCKDNADDSEQDCETNISTPDVADAKTDIVVRSDLCVEGAGTTAKNLASTAEGVGSTAEGVAPSDKGVVSTTKEIGFTGQDVAPIAEGVGSPGEHVASTGQDVAPIAKGVASTGEHVASTGQDVAPIAKGVGSTGEHVASTGQDVAPIAKGVGSTGEHVASTGQDLAPIAEGVASTDNGIASTDEGVASTAEHVASSDEGVASSGDCVASAAERIASSDKDVASTDKGVSSTDRGIVSSDKGVASIDKGMSSSDEGKVSLDGKKLHKQQQCSAQPSPNKTATDRQSTPPPTIPSTGHADIVSKPCTVSTTPVSESSLTKGVTFSSVTTVVKAENDTAIHTGLSRKITTTNTSGISRQVALSSSPLRKSIRSYSANSIAVAKSDQRLNSGERSQLADDSLTTFSAEILQRFTSRFSSPGNIPCKSGNSERAASDTSMLLSCLDECAIDVWRSHQ